MENSFKLHEQIQLLRKQKGITQEELAKHFNVTNQSVSKWESGQSCPDITLLPELASYFNVSIDKLLGHSAPSSMENLYLEIRELFETLPKESVYEMAFKLSALMHEAVCSKGFKEYIPWPLKNRLVEKGYSGWGYSANSEPDGISIMTSGLMVMGYLPEPKFPNRAGINMIYSLLSNITDQDTLTFLFTLYKQTCKSVDSWSTIDDTVRDTKIRHDKVLILIDKLIVENFIEENVIDETTVYRISGPFACILPVIKILSSKPIL